MHRQAMKPGLRAYFRYPNEFTTLPEYTTHRDQIVTVLHELPNAEADAGEVGRMYRVKAADGWEGDAFEDEIEPVDLECVR